MGKITAYNSSSVIAALILLMKTSVLRLIFASCFAATLAACGSGAPEDMVNQTASTMTSVHTSVQTSVQVATNSPAPDCAAEGCNGLRIIDGNAEAYRFDAMRRAAAEPQS